MLTIFLAASSTSGPAPLGRVKPTSLLSLFIWLKKIYLLINEAQATDKHLSSALVKKVILPTLLIAPLI